MTKSRTIKWMALSAALQAANGSLALWQEVLPLWAFALVGTVLGMSTAFLAMYLRVITTLPLSERK